MYQTIINLIPPHRTYIETHTGGGNIFERKRRAPESILIDIDPNVCAKWRSIIAAPGVTAGAGDAGQAPAITVVYADAVKWLLARTWAGDEFVYCDPPYLMSTRRGGDLYDHEYTDADHVRLLDVLLSLRVPVMISGYRSELYDKTLASWRSFDFPSMTRRGLATETVWINYDPPAVLHDFSYVGKDYRERERMKRKRARWRAKLEGMDMLERAALLHELLELVPPELALSAIDHHHPRR